MRITGIRGGPSCWRSHWSWLRCFRFMRISRGAPVDNLTRDLAEYASSLSFDQLPPEVVRLATQRVVDTLACAIGAYDCEPALIGRRLAQGSAPERYPGRILGSRERASAEAASFVNTAMIRNLELNDTYEGGHPSDCLGG